MSNIFTSDDVIGWPTGIIRWCILEVLLCSAAIAGLNAMEFIKKNQLISGYPSGHIHDDAAAQRAQNYKDSANQNGANAGGTVASDLKPQISPPPTPVIGLTVMGAEDINDYEFIHQLWFYLLIHVICLGVAFHKHRQSGIIALWGYLHALSFGAFIFLHVNLTLFSR